MTTIVMNADRCDLEHEALLIEEYGEEVLRAGWNQQLALTRAIPAAQIDKHADLPADLINMDVDTFLKKMNEYQC